MEVRRCVRQSRAGDDTRRSEHGEQGQEHEEEHGEEAGSTDAERETAGQEGEEVEKAGKAPPGGRPVRRAGLEDCSARSSRRSRRSRPLEELVAALHTLAGCVDDDSLTVWNDTSRGTGAEVEAVLAAAAETAALPPTPSREYAKFPSDLEEPRLEHGKLRFEAHEQDLERAWTAIKDRVHTTNRLYCEMLVPRDRAGQRDEDARRDDVDERIREAQRLLDGLQ